MIQIKNLTFDYPEKRALDNVSFEVQEGTITALVGPNGSGKTTLLRNMAALTKPLSGEIIINGINAATNPREVHLQIGYLQDLFGLYDHLTVAQSLQFMAYSRLYEDDNIEEAIEIAIKRSGVASFLDKKVSSLSRGMRQRVGIAQAIIHNPKILLLDEPASGLDPEARHALSNLLLELRDSGMTIMVSSHILAELEDYSTEMLIIQDGIIVEHRSLLSKTSTNNFIDLELSFTSYNETIDEFILKINGVVAILNNGNKLHVKIDTDILPKHQLLNKLIEQGITVEEFSEVKINLQDEYIKTVANYKQSKAL
jgi:ABC-2 type transport system ATP-binding protein